MRRYAALVAATSLLAASTLALSVLAAPALAQSVPAAPANLAGAAGDAQVTLSWDDPGDSSISSYDYRVGTTSGGTTTWSPDWTSISGSDATTTSHVVTGLTDGTEYNFEVRATNANGDGAAASVTATPVAVPVAPVGLWAEAASGEVTLRWDDPGDALITGYEYRVGTTFAGVTTWSPDWTAVSGSDAATVSHTATGLTDGTRYDFEVRAANTSGAGAAAGVDMIPKLIGTVASDPATVASAGQHTFTVSGSGFDANQSLNVTPCTVPGDALTPASTGLEIAEQASTMTWADCDLTGRVTVTTDADGDFSVSAAATIGANFAWEVADTAYTQSGLHVVFVLAVPVAPVGLWAEAASGQATLRWDDPGDALITGYEYRVGTTATDGTTAWSPDWTEISGSGAATTSHTATGLADGTAYDFEVRAANTSGAGAAASVTAVPRLVGAVASDPATVASAGQHTFTVSGSGFTAGSSLSVAACTVPGAALTPASTVLDIAEQAAAMGDDDCDTAGAVSVTADADGDFSTTAAATIGANFAWYVADTAETQSGLHVVFIVAVPVAPVGLWAEAASGQAVLRWDDPGDALITGYEYRVGTTATDGTTAWSPDWTAVSGSGAATTSHTATGLADGTEYDFEVRATNTSGAGAAAGTTMIPRLVGAVASDPATVASAGQHTFTVSGSGFTAGSSLSVTPCIVPGAALTPASTVLEIAEQAAAMGDDDCDTAGAVSATVGADGDFSVSAAAAVGANFAWYVADTANTQSGLHVVFVLAVPVAPVGLWAEAASGQAVLRWDDPGDALITGYEYRVGTTATDGTVTWSPDWTAVSGSGAATTSHTATGLADGTEYDFEVRAANTSGAGAAASVTAVPRLVGAVASDPATAASAGQRSFTVSGSGFTAGSSLSVAACTVPGAALTPASTVLDIAEQAAAMGDDDCDTAGAVSVTADADGDFSTTATATIGANFAWYVADAAETQGGLHVVFIVAVPVAPVGLWAEAASGQAVLRWDDPGDALITGYEYRVGTTATDGTVTWSPDWTAVSGSGAATTSHTATGLADGTEYNFEVRAANTSGAGAAAGVVAVPRLVGAVASDPATAASAGQRSFTVSGSGFTAGSSLSVAACTVPGAALTPASTVLDIAEQAAAMGDDDCDTAGAVSVTADADGDFSTTATATVGANFAWYVADAAETQSGLHVVFIVAVPVAPVGLWAEAASGEVTLRWDDPGDALITGYEYRVGTTDTDEVTTWSPDWTAVSGSGAATTSHTATGLANGTRYDFEVRAANTSGAGAAADVTATPRLVGAVASDPATVASAGQHTFEVSGSGFTPGSSLNVFPCTVPGDALTPASTVLDIAEQASTMIWWVDCDLTGWVSVTAADDGDFSTTAAATIGANFAWYVDDTAGTQGGLHVVFVLAVPVAPVGLWAEAASGQAVLRWDDPGDALITGYEYRVGTTATDGTTAWSPDWTAVSGSGAATTSHTATGLADGTAYDFEVRAANTSGAGAAASVTAVPRLVGAVASDPATVASAGQRSFEVSGSGFTAGSSLSVAACTVPGAALTPASTVLDIAEQAAAMGDDDCDTAGAVSVTADADGAFSTTATATIAENFAWYVDDAAETQSGLHVVFIVAVPVAPVGLWAEAASGQAVLRWDDPGDALITGYEYRVGTTATDGTTAWSPDWTAVSGSGAATTSHTATGLADGTEYDFEVRAANTSGAGAAAGVAAVPRLVGAVASDPATVASAGQHTFTVSGSGFTAGSSLSVAACTVPGAALTPASTVLEIAEQAAAMGDDDCDTAGAVSATVGADGDFSVSAAAAVAENFAWYVADTAETQSGLHVVFIVAVPVAPVGLWAETASGQAVLRWDDPGDALITGYEYRVGTTATDGTTAWSPDWTAVSGSGAATTSHTATGLANGTEYNFEVRAANTSGAGAAASVTAIPRLVGAVASDPATAASAGQRSFEVSGSGFTAGSSLSVAACTVPGAALTVASTVLDIAEQAAAMGDDDCDTAGAVSVTAGADGDFSTTATAAVAANFAWYVDDAAETQGGLHVVFIVAVPVAPVGLWAETASGQAVLRWDDPGDALITGYEYRVGTTSGTTVTWSPDWTAVSGSGAATTSHTATGLADGTEYTFEVRAANTSGAGAAAGVVAVPRLVGAVASDPATAASAGQRSFTVSGSGFTAGSSLSVAACTVPGDALTPASTVLEIAEQAAAMGDDDCDTAGAVSVTAGADGDFSTTATATVGANFAWYVADAAETQSGLHVVFIVAVPVAPVGLWAEAASGQAVLRWDDPGDALITGYEYRVGTTDTDEVTTWSPDWTDVSGSGAATTSHTATGLANGTRYDFEVRAANTSGAGAAADVTATPRLVGAVASDPATVASAGQHTFEVSGSGFTPGSSLNVFPCTVPGDALTPASTVLDIAEQASTMIWWVDCDLTGWVSVTAADDGDFSTTAAATIGANFAWYVDDTAGTQGGLHVVFVLAVPVAPAGLWAEAASGQAVLRWDDPGDALITGYEYRVGTTATDGTVTWSPDWTAVSGSGAATTSHTATGLADGTEYNFEVRAANTSGAGAAASVTAVPRLVGAVASDPATAASAGQRSFEVSGSGFTAGSSLSVAACTVPGAALTPASTVLDIAEQAAAMGDDDCDTAGAVSVTADADGDFSTTAAAAVGANFAWYVADTAETQSGLHVVFIVAVPVAPVGLWAETASGQAVLRWDDPGDALITGYEYRVGTTATDGTTAWSPDWTEISGSGATTTSHTATGLANGTEYTFEVRAANTSGAGAAASVAAIPAPAPVAPVGLSAATASGQVTLGWDDPGDASITGYEYRVGTTSGTVTVWDPDWTAVSGSGAATVSYAVTGLVDGTEYTFEVRAVNSTGDGAAAGVAAVPVPAPVAPVGLSAATASGQVTLGWDDPGDASITGYEYRVGTTSGGTTVWDPDWTAVSGSGAATVSYAVTGLVDGTEYTFEVRAVNSTGDGAAAGVAAVPVPAPVAPVGLSAATASGQVTLGWDDPFDALITGYEYRVGTTATDGTVTWDPDWTAVSGSGAATVSYAVTGLVDGTEYTFEVRAVNSTGDGAAAGVVAVPVPAPVAPVGLSAATASGQVTLGWDDPFDASITGYEYRVGTTSGTATVWDPDWTAVSGSGAATVSYAVTGLVDGAEYTFEVRAVNSTGAGAAAGVVAVPVPAPVAPAGLLGEPASGQVALSWEDPFDASITGYEYRVGTTSGGTTSWSPDWTAVSGSDDTTVSHTVTGLTNGTSYKLQVRAANSTGDGASAGVTVTARLVGTVTADPVSVGAAGQQTFTVAGSGFDRSVSSTLWVVPCTVPGDELTPASTPREIALALQAMTFNSSDCTFSATVWATVDSDGDFSVSAGAAVETNFAWAVRDPWSTQGGDVLVFIIPLPDAPTGLVGATASGQVTLSWDDPDDDSITGYEYRVGTTSGGVTSWDPDWTGIADSDDTTTSHTATGLVDGTTYTFEVRAANTSGHSTTASVTATPAPPPAAPANLVGATASGQVTLSWDDPDDDSITGYEYRVGTTGSDGTVTWDPDWGDIAGSDDDTVSHTVTGLVDGTAYTFEVRAANTSGHSTASSVTATPSAP